VLVDGYSFLLLRDDLAWSIWALELGVWAYIMITLGSVSIYLLTVSFYIAASSSVMLIFGILISLWVALNGCGFICLQMCLSGGGACIKLVAVFLMKFVSVISVALATVLKQVANECRAICNAIHNGLSALFGRRDTEPREAGDPEQSGGLSEPLMPDSAVRTRPHNATRSAIRPPLMKRKQSVKKIRLMLRVALRMVL
jgi:hypothetical protein